tara:strand:- start:9963 stop:11081 length:1119 start_codon:yes stop_codon:yes gene_type:complete
VNTPAIPTLMVIPTGIGCAIGGYAGDAIPSARLLAAASGCLITHPNVMNGASLYWSDSRIHYVEGYGIDRFAAGEIYLRPVRQQKIGILFDSGLETNLLERHMQVIDACRASLGLNIGPIVKTNTPLEIILQKGSSGVSWGEIGEPDVLISAGEKLKELGATAIAIVSRFPDELNSEAVDLYRRGEGVDALAGAEAIISHLLVRQLMLPCAHSPALATLPLDYNLDPRAAAEDLGYTFLTSVLVGLNRAPDLIPISEYQIKSNKVLSTDEFLKPSSLGAIVVPEGALGGEAVLACLEREVPVIAVKNSNLLKLNSASFKIDNNLINPEVNILHAMNYAEAAGLLISLREGLNPTSLYRPLGSVNREFSSDFS